jgi:hypothetical protein
MMAGNMSKLTVASRWRRSLWRNGALVAAFALLYLQKTGWTSLWLQVGIALAMSWLAVAAISGWATQSLAAVLYRVLVTIAICTLWLGDHIGVRLPASVTVSVVVVWAASFSPSRKATSPRTGSWLM